MAIKIGVAATVALTFCTAADAANTERTRFCGVWKAVCDRTKTGDGSECVTRHKDCMANGCFFFYNPRARCENNAFDVSLTRPEARGLGCPDCRR